MAELNRQQKRDWAKLIYTKEHLSHKEIAAKVGVSQQSITKWSQDDHWEDLRISIVVTKEEQLRRLYMQITEMTDNIMNRPEGKRFADPKEADTIIKLTSAIKNLETETSIAEIIDVSMKFLSWLREVDISKAKELGKLFDSYIKERLSAI